jgi:hypothetical protein
MIQSNDAAAKRAKRNRLLAGVLGACTVLRLMDLIPGLSAGLTALKVVDLGSEVLVSTYTIVVLLGGVDRARNLKIVTFLILPLVVVTCGFAIYSIPKRTDAATDLKPYNKQIRDLIATESNWASPAAIQRTFKAYEQLNTVSAPLLDTVISNFSTEVDQLNTSPSRNNPDTVRLLSLTKLVLANYILQRQEHALLDTDLTLWTEYTNTTNTDTVIKEGYMEKIRETSDKLKSIDSESAARYVIIRQYIDSGGLAVPTP